MKKEGRNAQDDVKHDTSISATEYTKSTILWKNAMSTHVSQYQLADASADHGAGVRATKAKRKEVKKAKKMRKRRI